MTVAPWWRDAAIYQVCLRSFADSDGDGIGDLAGLREELNHLVRLGVPLRRQGTRPRRLSCALPWEPATARRSMSEHTNGRDWSGPCSRTEPPSCWPARAATCSSTRTTCVTTPPRHPLDLLAGWYDLLVAAGDILLAPGLIDITRSVTGALNDEIDVHADGVPTSHEAVAGSVWRRVVETPHGQLVHLINLTGQDETGWDTPKNPLDAVGGLTLRVRRVGDTVPVVRVADPDAGPCFTAVPVRVDGNHALADLPAWQLVLISDH